MLERLQKIIARAGIASRRHAEELIRSGQVRVNGQTVTELGAKADPEHDRVEAVGQVAHRPDSAAYYILYKPPYVVSTMSDPEGRTTLRHLLRGLAGGVFPVGRLDYSISGLLLLTTDGELADRMFKASSRIPKVYWIKVKGALGHDLLREIGHRAHARLRLLRGPSSAKKNADNPWYEAQLNEARSDALRTELFAAGHPVEKMKRVQLGPLELDTLPEGHYRQLAPSEVARLRNAIDRAEKAPRPISKPAGGKRWFRSTSPNAGRAAHPDANHVARRDASRSNTGEGRPTRDNHRNRQPGAAAPGAANKKNRSGGRQAGHHRPSHRERRPRS